MIYLDNAATTFPKPEAVYNAMDKMNREGAVNAGRGSYKSAQKASRLIDDTKNKLRNLIHANINAPVVFSPSITIAMNQIIHGLNLKNGAIVYLSPYEHNAVARCIYYFSKEKTITIKELPLDDSLNIDIEKMKCEFAIDKPEFVFCNHVSNVTGYILPVAEIFAEAKRYNAITILDTAQSLGLVEVDSSKLNADIIAFAGHKTLYGPFGIGGFFNVSGIDLNVFISGGTGSDSLNLEMPSGPETKYEASSCNIVAIAGLNAALSEISVVDNYKYERELTDYLIEKLSDLDDINLYLTSQREAQVGIVSFTVNGYNSEDIGMILDEDFDIAVRTGYHCAPLIHKYLKDETFLGTVRVGIGCFTTREDIDRLVDALKDIIYE